MLLTSCVDNPEFIDFDLDDYLDGNENVLVDTSDETMKQLTIEVLKEFPNTDFLALYSKLLKNNNFIQCGMKRSGWESFMDATNDRQVRVFRNFKYYIKPESNILVSVILEYESKIESDVLTPDNNKQKVKVVQYHQMNLKQSIKELDLKCNRK